MPSPFPGMDPYLEAPAFWSGFHLRLIAAISTELNRHLPERYYAEIDEYVWLHTEDDGTELLGKPDVFVPDKNGSHTKTRGGQPNSAAVLAPPVDVTMPRAKKRKQRFVKIVAADHQTVVTVIEILSPTNKVTSEGRKKYLEKRNEYLGSTTSFVELDLLRAGERMAMGRPSPPDADYYFFVCRGGKYPKAQVWPFTVRDPIPAFPVPLGPKDADVPLNLQYCMAEIYDSSRYGMRIDYSQSTAPALRPADAEWAAELLKKSAKKK